MAEASTNQLHPFMAVDETLEWLDKTPPGRWPTWHCNVPNLPWAVPGEEVHFARWPNVIEAMKLKLKRFAETIDSAIPPRNWYGRGIVIAGGGKYIPATYVNVRYLREICKCSLPIEIWHLGLEEMDLGVRRIFRDLGCEVIDAREIEKQFPARILAGWELKPYSVLHSKFAEVLFMDADNCVLRDPSFLFDEEPYLQTGAVFWPDYPSWHLPLQVWLTWGMDWMTAQWKHERPFESGQYLINKCVCARELRLALWFCEWSDYTFRSVYGDKETFHLAWRYLGRDYAMPARGPGWLTHTIIQHDFAGNPLFLHRCRDKMQLACAGNTFEQALEGESARFAFAMELAKLWDGTLWVCKTQVDNEDAYHAERERIVKTRWLYKRVGYDERMMEFREDGFIGLGAAGCEVAWELHQSGEKFYLAITRVREGTSSWVATCVLERAGDGNYYGRWFEFEKMPIALVAVCQLGEGEGN